MNISEVEQTCDIGKFREELAQESVDFEYLSVGHDGRVIYTMPNGMKIDFEFNPEVEGDNSPGKMSMDITRHRPSFIIIYGHGLRKYGYNICSGPQEGASYLSMFFDQSVKLETLVKAKEDFEKLYSEIIQNNEPWTEAI